MLARIIKYLCSLIIYSFASIILTLLLPIYVFRVFVGSILIHFYPAVDKLLTTRSSLFGADEIYKKPKCTILWSIILEGTLTLEEARKVAPFLLLEPLNSNGELQRPELQQYVSPFWGFLAWKWDYNFDIKNHIRMYNGRHQAAFMNRTKPVNSETLLEVGEELLVQPFQHQRSPWAIHIIHNYHETNPVSGLPAEPAQTAIIVQVHHSLADGFTFNKTFLQETDVKDEDDIKNVNLHNDRPPVRSLLHRIGIVLDFVLSAPYELFTDQRNASDVNSWHVPEKQLEPVVNRGISSKLPMTCFKEIRKLHRVTFTSVILECFTAAIRKFMMEAGFSVPDVITCMTVLPFPGHPETGNHFTIGFIKLPVGLSDSIQRIQAIEEAVTYLKKSSFPTMSFYMAPLGGGLFRWMLPGILRLSNGGVTAVMSNVPGPQHASTFLNYKVVSTWFLLGLHEGNVGMILCAYSYNGEIRILPGLDNGIVSKSELPASNMVEYFMEEMDSLKRQAFV